MAASSEPGRQVRLEGGRGAVADHQADLRVGAAHPVEQERGQPARRGADHADPGRADDLVAQGGDVGDGRLELGGDPPAPFHDGLAFLGQLAAVAIDELHPELPLQPGHVAGDVGLHGLQGGGRGRETAVVGDGDERLQLPEVHQHHRYHRYGSERFDRSRSEPGRLSAGRVGTAARRRR